MNEYDRTLDEMLSEYSLEEIEQKVLGRIHIKLNKKVKKEDCSLQTRNTLKSYMAFPELCKITTIERVANAVVRDVKKR